MHQYGVLRNTCCLLVTFLLWTNGIPDAVAAAGERLAQPPLLTLNTADKPPYSTENNTGLYDVMLIQAFSRVGLQVRINHLPSARSIENVDLGLDDAEYARIKGLTRQYKNIIMVNEKLADFSFTAFSRDAGIHVSDWEDLSNYNIAFMKGWKIYEQNVTSARSIQVVSSEVELFSMLLNDRVDIILYERLRGLAYMQANRISGVYALDQSLAERGMYLYLHVGHAELVPELERVLLEMKQSGEYDDIIQAYLQ